MYGGGGGVCMGGVWGVQALFSHTFKDSKNLPKKIAVLVVILPLTLQQKQYKGPV